MANKQCQMCGGKLSASQSLRKTTGMYGKVERITPEIAKRYLLLSTGNRKIRKSRLHSYMAALRAGEWWLNHQGIAFDVDGVFTDGHHRMEMIVQTGIAVDMWVVRNSPTEGKTEIDQGLMRSTKDALAMADAGVFSHQYLAVARSFCTYPDHSNPVRQSPQEVLAVMHKFLLGIEFACDQLKNNLLGVTKAVRCSVARAHYHVDGERLSEFCNLLSTGESNGKPDQAGLTYRNWLLRHIGRTGYMLENERYGKGSNAIRAFAKYEPLMRAHMTHEDCFPVVGDLPQQSVAGKA